MTTASQFPSGHRGTVSNVVSGSVGTLIQAGDVRGGIWMGDDGPRVVQTSGVDDVHGEIGVPAGLVGELSALLQQIQDGDLGQRIIAERAADLMGRLDDCR
jgi:hypothetical protein